MAPEQMIKGVGVACNAHALCPSAAALCATLICGAGMAQAQDTLAQNILAQNTLTQNKQAQNTQTQAADRIIVFAAASLADALAETAAAFAPDGTPEIVYSFAGSAALARQIQFGAPADLFVSAAPDWAAALSEAGLVEEGAEVDLVGNSLVLIEPLGDRQTPTSTDPPPNLDAGFPLLDALGDGRLAVALVEAVPAGIYARDALHALGLWDDVRDRLAETDNVRAALALVAIGATPRGIVYATDAQAEPRVRVVARIPPETHGPIVYPMVDLAGRDTAAENAYFDFLSGPVAAEIFTRHGFSTLRAAP